MLPLDTLRSFERRALPVVRADWMTLGAIPPKWISPALCDAALDASPWAIQFVPEHLATMTRVRDAIERDSRIGRRDSRIGRRDSRTGRRAEDVWVLAHVKRTILEWCAEIGVRVQVYGDDRDDRDDRARPGAFPSLVRRYSPPRVRGGGDTEPVPYEVYLDGVANFGMRFKRVPAEFRGRLAFDLVRRDPDNIRRVPAAYRSPDVCRAYVRHGKRLSDIPPEHLDLSMALSCVTVGGARGVEGMPKRFQRMKQICANALFPGRPEIRAFELAHVPRWMRSPLMQRIARVEVWCCDGDDDGSNAALFARSEVCCVDDDVVFNAAFFARSTLRTLPSDIPRRDESSRRDYQPALRAAGFAIAQRVKALRGAISPDGRLSLPDRGILQYVSPLLLPPDWLECEDFCVALVEESAAHFRNIPQHARTYRVCLAAVTVFGHFLEYVPEEWRTREMCLRAVTSKGSALRYVPSEQRTLEVCSAAVRSNPLAVGNIPVDAPFLPLIRFDYAP